MNTSLQEKMADEFENGRWYLQ